LTYYVEDPLVNFTIISLIVIGGIGFLVWDDIGTHKWNMKKYRSLFYLVIGPFQ